MKLQTIPEHWDVDLWGYPWHGRVEGGTLTLPNAATMTMAQPEWQPYNRWWAGAVWVQQHPSKAPNLSKVIRAGQGGINDSAAGRTWLNYVLLSGRRMQFYGKPLNDWLYVDSVGDVWNVGFTEPSAQVGQPIAGSVVLERFGVVGGTAESYSYPVSLSSHGATGASGISTFTIQLEDITRDGRKAIMSLSADPYTTGTHTYNVAQSGVGLKPFAFIELEISGTGAAATVQLRSLRTQAQTLSGSESISNTFDNWLMRVFREETHASSCGVEGPGGTYQITRTYTPQGIMSGGSFSAPGTNIGLDVIAYVQTLGKTRTARHILSMRYDDSGQTVEVVMEANCSASVYSPQPSTPGVVTHVMTATCPGPSVSAESTSRITVSRSCTNTSVTTITLSAGGNVIATASLTYSKTVDAEIYFDVGGASTPMVNTTVIAESVSSSMGTTTNWGGTSVGASGSLGDATGVVTPIDHTNPRTLHPVVLGGNGMRAIEAVRWSNYMFGLRGGESAASVPVSGSVLNWMYSAAAGRWASAPSFNVTNPPGEIEYRFGAEDPITNTAQIGSRSPFGFV